MLENFQDSGYFSLCGRSECEYSAERCPRGCYGTRYVARGTISLAVFVCFCRSVRREMVGASASTPDGIEARRKSVKSFTYKMRVE